MLYCDVLWVTSITYHDKSAVRREPRHQFLGCIEVSPVIHDDVTKWKNFPRYWPLCGEFTGNRWIPLAKASDAELWCLLWSPSRINNWVNNREAGYLRRHRAHYDVIVVIWVHIWIYKYTRVELLVHIWIYKYTPVELLDDHRNHGRFPRGRQGCKRKSMCSQQ